AYARSNARTVIGARRRGSSASGGRSSTRKWRSTASRTTNRNSAFLGRLSHRIGQPVRAAGKDSVANLGMVLEEIFRQPAERERIERDRRAQDGRVAIWLQLKADVQLARLARDPAQVERLVLLVFGVGDEVEA